MVDTFEDGLTVSPNWDALLAFYNQPNPAQLSKGDGYPHASFDSISRASAKSVGNDWTIQKQYFGALEQRVESHHSVQLQNIADIQKNKEVSEYFKRKERDTQDKAENASTISRIAGWLTWFFSGAALVATIAGLGFALVTGGISVVLSVIPVVLAAFSGITGLTKAFFDYKTGKHKQETTQQKADREARQKAITSKTKQNVTEYEREIDLARKQREAQKTFYETVISFFKK